MLAIYAAVNGVFAANSFGDFTGIDYVGSFDQRFAILDEDARQHLMVMLSRAESLPGNLLEKARSLLARVGIPATADRLELARRVMCEARAVAAGTFIDPTLSGVANVMATVAALAQSTTRETGRTITASLPSVAVDLDETISQPIAPVAAVSATAIAASGLVDDQRRFAHMTANVAVEDYMRVKPKAGDRQVSSGQTHLNNPSATPRRTRESQPKVWGDSQRTSPRRRRSCSASPTDRQLVGLSDVLLVIGVGHSVVGVARACPVLIFRLIFRAIISFTLG